MRAIGKVAASLLLLLLATGSTLAYAKVEAVLDRARVAMGDSLQLTISATDNDALDAGLQWEVMENEGTGPDMQERIAAFTKK